MTRSTLAWLFAASLAAGACNQTDFGNDGEPTAEDGGDHGDDDGPGSGAREDENIGCEAEDDCGNGESCVEGVCQMARCKDGPYISAPPLGDAIKFYLDRELIIADGVASEGQFHVDGYAPEAGSIEYPGSWSMGATKILDVAGGDFYGTGAELFVTAFEGKTTIKLGGSDDSLELDVGFPPYAIAAGDLDRDRKDEVVVLGQFGNVAVCQFDEGTCSTFVVENGTGEDVAVADVDGDGYAEAVLLLAQGDTRLLYVWQADAAETGDEDYYGDAGHQISRIDAGDLDGDKVGEIVAFEDDGVISGAKLYVYSAAEGQVAEIRSQGIDDASRDLTLADLDMDDQDELVVLREGGVIELLETGGGMELTSKLTHQLQVSGDPLRISASDFDGDSPRARLMNDEAMLLPGPVTPIMAVHFPPYDSERSEGTSVAFVGDGEINGAGTTDFVTLRANMELGVSGSLFGIVSGGVGTRIAQEITTSYTQATSQYVGTRIVSQPSKSLVGYDYGLVVLSCSCFHAYYYEMIDPFARLGAGADEEPFVLLMPVGGTSTVWSSKRYNAMAEAVGDLPIVTIPYEIGNPASYPSGPAKADGGPIPAEDFVFAEVPNLLVSDSANLGWWLSAAESETNEVAMNTSVDVTASLGVGPFKFGVGLGETWGQSQSVTVGSEMIFSGSVPPIPDDPSTPEDEYLSYAFGFSPYVYREHYRDRDGNDAAYYVTSYAVARE